MFVFLYNKHGRGVLRFINIDLHEIYFLILLIVSIYFLLILYKCSTNIIPILVIVKNTNEPKQTENHHMNTNKQFLYKYDRNKEINFIDSLKMKYVGIIGGNVLITNCKNILLAKPFIVVCKIPDPHGPVWELRPDYSLINTTTRRLSNYILNHFYVRLRIDIYGLTPMTQILILELI